MIAVTDETKYAVIYTTARQQLAVTPGLAKFPLLTIPVLQHVDVAPDNPTLNPPADDEPTLYQYNPPPAYNEEVLLNMDTRRSFSSNSPSPTLTTPTSTPPNNVSPIIDYPQAANKSWIQRINPFKGGAKTKKRRKSASKSSRQRPYHYRYSQKQKKKK